MIEEYKDCITKEQQKAFDDGVNYGLMVESMLVWYSCRSETEGDAFAAGCKNGAKIFAKAASENLDVAMKAAVKTIEQRLGGTPADKTNGEQK